MKLSSANQSIALIAPRLSVGSAKVASTASGGSNSMIEPVRLMALQDDQHEQRPDHRERNRHMRRAPQTDQLNHVQIASGQAGHVKSGRFFSA